MPSFYPQSVSDETRYLSFPKEFEVHFFILAITHAKAWSSTLKSAWDHSISCSIWYSPFRSPFLVSSQTRGYPPSSINPEVTLENLFRAEMPVNTRTCSKFILIVVWTTIPSKFLVRALVFFGLYTSHDDSQCPLWVQLDTLPSIIEGQKGGKLLE